MEIKQVMKRLASCSIIPFDTDAEEISAVSIAALEKQIPKKVIREPSVWPDGQDRIKLFCPVCKEMVSADEKYCSECGQCLDWSENDG